MVPSKETREVVAPFLDEVSARVACARRNHRIDGYQSS